MTMTQLSFEVEAEPEPETEAEVEVEVALAPAPTPQRPPSKWEMAMVPLLERLQAGDKRAMDEIVALNEGMVKHVAKRWRKHGSDAGLELEDLWQAGRIGVLKDAKRRVQGETAPCDWAVTVRTAISAAIKAEVVAARGVSRDRWTAELADESLPLTSAPGETIGLDDWDAPTRIDSDPANALVEAVQRSQDREQLHALLLPCGIPPSVLDTWLDDEVCRSEADMTLRGLQGTPEQVEAHLIELAKGVLAGKHLAEPPKRVEGGSTKGQRMRLLPEVERVIRHLEHGVGRHVAPAQKVELPPESVPVAMFDDEVVQMA